MTTLKEAWSAAQALGGGTCGGRVYGDRESGAAEKAWAERPRRSRCSASERLLVASCRTSKLLPELTYGRVRGYLLLWPGVRPWKGERTRAWGSEAAGVAGAGLGRDEELGAVGASRGHRGSQVGRKARGDGAGHCLAGSDRAVAPGPLGAASAARGSKRSTGVQGEGRQGKAGVGFGRWSRAWEWWGTGGRGHCRGSLSRWL